MISFEPHGIFYLDASSSSVCLLFQLEKHATEESRLTPPVYSRKEPVCPNIYDTRFLKTVWHDKINLQIANFSALSRWRKNLLA
ncbi:hypothetical protein C1H46_036311 [Malus baccata]|uniref:Uncharacterized protein n=1 Tax=Malus baccata TaxID=106549 RepID=A0A540KVW2_MALBA|nr:hypothetical protein C1H46_036311 [Malus baccata]